MFRMGGGRTASRGAAAGWAGAGARRGAPLGGAAARAPVGAASLASTPRGLKTGKSSLRSAFVGVFGGAGLPSAPVLGLSAGFGGALALVQKHPFASQVAIATSTTSVADLITQKAVERRERVDWERNALFLAFGFAYLGVAQWGLYVRMFSRLFPDIERFCNLAWRDKIRDRAGIKTLFAQIGLDFFFVQPFIYYPAFYSFKTLVEETDGKSRPRQAFEKWRDNFIVDNLGMMAFWFPLEVVILSVPLWLRMPLTHAVSFTWCTVLSFFRGGKEDKPVPLPVPGPVKA